MTDNKSPRVSQLEAALELALLILEAREPQDSRAVSDEFVAMAAVLAECANESALTLIEEGLKIPRTHIELI